MPNNESQDLLDILFDLQNKDPIIFQDGEGKKMTFKQIAVIPFDHDDERRIYALLSPLDRIEGLDSNALIVFRVNIGDDEEETTLSIEEDEVIANAVYAEFIKSTEQADAEEDPQDC